MTEMTDGHSAEKVKEAIELIINNFKFDKAKVKGKNSSSFFNLNRYIII